MESSVVLFKPRIHLFACTHPSVSNSLDCNDWLAYKHQFTALCSNTFGLWFFVENKHQSPPCVSNMSRLWILICVHASVSSPVFQTRLDYGSASVYKHLSPVPFDQTRLDWSSLLCTSFSLHPCFKHILWFLVRVHHQSTALLSQTRIDFGFLFVYPPTHTKMRVTRR